MAGEVIIKPPPGEGAEAVRSRESPPRWWYTYQVGGWVGPRAEVVAAREQ
jgi:hypothetical protein